ncbi:MAG: hypothetical protein D6790_07395 [Caldilineae bacterium]|nr:MAG: hypothetical protein D6790_07395 [Caldilineae bacterium]
MGNLPAGRANPDTVRGGWKTFVSFVFFVVFAVNSKMGCRCNAGLRTQISSFLCVFAVSFVEQEAGLILR